MSPSPPDLPHEVYPKKEEENFYPLDPHFLPRPLKMSEKNIHHSLSTLHDTIALVSNSCWRDASMEEPYSIENL